MNRILIVDDEAMLLETMAASLSRDDYAIDTAQDGAQALRLLDVYRYDLVLSDVRMPELDGPQLYDAIKTRHQTTMPAVVFMTGHAGDSLHRALRPGVLVLQKPLSLTALRETIERVLATR